MFGKKKSVVGLDIGSSFVKAVELTEVGDRLCITGFGCEPVASKDALADTVAETFKRAGIKTKRVVTAVSGRSVIVRYINMVSMSDDDLKSALRFEADKYIPFELDEVILDCAKLEEFDQGQNGNKEMKVLLVAVKRALIDEHIELIQRLGLLPTVVDVDSFAIGNAFELNSLNSPRVDDEEKVIALVDVGATKTNINILKGSTSYFSREVYLAGNDFTESISRRLGIDVTEAHQIKVQPEGRMEEVEECVLPALEDLGNEIHLSFDFFENQFDKEVDEVFISGGSALIPGLKSTFERVFDRHIEVWNPTEYLEIRGDRINVQDLKNQGHQLAVAVGLASRILDR
jgi:type IV pilus assembly protein PilM